MQDDILGFMISTPFFMSAGFLIKKRATFICFMIALLTACSQSSPDKDSAAQSGDKQPIKQQELNANAYKTIEWIDLMPQDDLDALLNPPAYLDEIEDGSEQDQLSSQFQLNIPQAGDDRYQQALTSTRIMPAFDNQKIKIPGFIVPLEFGNNQMVTRFFFVPYFGACIHVPPPPPNQIIYGVFDKGVRVNHLHEPFWLTGVLKTTLTENDVATSAYTLTVAEISPYTE